jgi:transcriptional regulator with XRE-family HTH domain
MLLISYRKKLGVTQKEMARRIGVLQSVYSRWESGERRPSGENVVRIRRATKGAVNDYDLIRVCSHCKGEHLRHRCPQLA